MKNTKQRNFDLNKEISEDEFEFLLALFHPKHCKDSMDYSIQRLLYKYKDYLSLRKNGLVHIFPCKTGDTLYKWDESNNKITKLEVLSINVKHVAEKHSVFIQEKITAFGHNGTEIFDFNDINKTVFTSKENLITNLIGFPVYTWDDLYVRAENKGVGDAELTAKDTARGILCEIIKDSKGYNIDDCEIPEEEIETFLDESPILYLFNESGNLLGNLIS